MPHADIEEQWQGYLRDHWVIEHANGAPLHDARVNANLHQAATPSRQAAAASVHWVSHIAHSLRLDVL